MKTLLVILCLISSMLVNAQNIDYNNFNKETLNETVFGLMERYVMNTNGYSITLSSDVQKNVMPAIRKTLKNKKNLPLDSLYTPNTSYTEILDSIPCNGIKTYIELAEKAISDWENSWSSYFMGFGKTAGVTNYYNKRTKTLYISFIFLK